MASVRASSSSARVPAPPEGVDVVGIGLVVVDVDVVGVDVVGVDVVGVELVVVVVGDGGSSAVAADE